MYQRLLQAILSSELQPGERLIVPALAQQLNVSRSPVREAVQRLIRERLAIEEPHRGAVVAQIRQEDLLYLYDVREMLEGLAARRAAERMTEDDLAALRDALARHEQLVEQGELEAHVEIDQDFHAIVRRSTQNQWLIEFLDELRSLVRLAMASTTVTAGPHKAVQDHRRILEALEAGDPDRAEATAREHIARLRTALRQGATDDDSDGSAPQPRTANASE